MPRIVDADRRRDEIVAATWNVIRRDGLAAASVRNVATEAGWSMGAIRHYFDDHDALLVAAMSRVAEQANRRATEAWRGAPDVRAAALAMLEELLPLDGERRAEAEVWLAFTARSLTNPTMAELRRTSHEALRNACAAVVQQLRASSDDDAAQIDSDTDRLHALIDGLALHAITHPDRMPAAASSRRSPTTSRRSNTPGPQLRGHPTRRNHPDPELVAASGSRADKLASCSDRMSPRPERAERGVGRAA